MTTLVKPRTIRGYVGACWPALCACKELALRGGDLAVLSSILWLEKISGYFHETVLTIWSRTCKQTAGDDC